MDAEFSGRDAGNRNVLTVGDGDFSFAVAFAVRYKGVKITATTLETDEVMKLKYPDFSNNIVYLSNLG